MTATIRAIDADGHILERQDEIRKYLDDRWSRRDTSLWPGGQPWDLELSGKLAPPYGYVRGMTSGQQRDLWIRICDENEIDKAVLFPTGSGNIAKT